MSRTSPRTRPTTVASRMIIAARPTTARTLLGVAEASMSDGPTSCASESTKSGESAMSTASAASVPGRRLEGVAASCVGSHSGPRTASGAAAARAPTWRRTTSGHPAVGGQLHGQRGRPAGLGLQRGDAAAQVAPPRIQVVRGGECGGEQPLAAGGVSRSSTVTAKSAWPVWAAKARTLGS